MSNNGSTVGSVSIRNVTKIFDPEGAHVLALDNCSLEIPAGEFCVIVGPSGCGKTTLLNAIAGFHGISSGEISLDGVPICTPEKMAEPGADRIVVFQNGALFPWYTVMENVIYGPVVQGKMTEAEARQAAGKILGEMGLQGIANCYINEISSGMRRRVEIARAMVNDLKILLMDEPYRAMDALTKSVMHKHLLDVYDRAHKTIFFITHDLEEAIYLGSRVVVMTTRPGRIKKVIDVDIPRPRDLQVLASERYRELKMEVLEAVQEEARKAFEAGEREFA
ncbi:MAG: ABC transporter ATP-binding protein [Desulfobacteraceae bacterium]|nr:ABC transporter ATP-binding protein [Desulfobacteraceae bacterium]